MQRLCGIDTPIGGKILDGNIFRDGASIRRIDYVHLGLESELAFRLARDIDTPFDGSDNDLLGCLASAHAAFEVVDDRHADFSKLVAGELVAENVWNVGAVLGEGVAPSALGPIDQLGGRYFEDGELIAAGSSADVLGNPLNVVRWLAQFLIERGSKLRAGDVILTGSIGPLRFPAEGTACRFEIDGLAPVEVRIV
jgi:2-keto-4-pentenoate hydratase